MLLPCSVTSKLDPRPQVWNSNFCQCLYATQCWCIIHWANMLLLCSVTANPDPRPQAGAAIPITAYVLPNTAAVGTVQLTYLMNYGSPATIPMTAPAGEKHDGNTRQALAANTCCVITWYVVEFTYYMWLYIGPYYGDLACRRISVHSLHSKQCCHSRRPCPLVYPGMHNSMFW